MVIFLVRMIGVTDVMYMNDVCWIGVGEKERK